MKNTYKFLYILIAILIFTYLALFTLTNIFIYGSIMQVNIPILILVVIFPLYLGFKEKNYLKQAIILMLVYIMIIGTASYLTLPKYTYNEAVELVEKEGYSHVESFKKNIGDSNYLYAGDYLVKTESGNFSVDINSGTIKKLEE